jgi:hypothetical protein
VTKLLVVLLPTIIASTAGAMYLGIFPGGRADLPQRSTPSRWSSSPS